MILVTGACGFLGRHLVPRLLKAGKTVRCVCRPAPGPSAREWLARQPVDIVYGYLHDPRAMESAFRGVRHVIHLAAPIKEVRGAVVDQFYRRAHACLVDAAQRAGVDHFVMVDPIGSDPSASLPFLKSCGSAEAYVRASGLPHVILHSSLMFGAGDRLITGIMALVRRTGLLLIPGTRKTMLQPIWAGDVVSCLLCALRGESLLDRTIAIGGPHHMSYEEAADRIGTMLNIPRSKIHISRRLTALVGRVLEGLGRNPFPAYRHLEMLDAGAITALDAVKHVFGFQPMPLAESVAYALNARRDPPHASRGSGIGRGSDVRTRHGV